MVHNWVYWITEQLLTIPNSVPSLHLRECLQFTPHFPCRHWAMLSENTKILLSKRGLHRHVGVGFLPFHKDSLLCLLPNFSLPALQGLPWFWLGLPAKKFCLYLITCCKLFDNHSSFLHLGELQVLLTMPLQGLWKQNVGKKAGVSQRKAKLEWIHSKYWTLKGGLVRSWN